MTPPPDSAQRPNAEPAASDLARNNFFLRLFFGDVPIDRGMLRLLRMVSLGVFFENYDIGLVNSALPQIAPDLGMEMGETGFYLGAVRLGGLGTLLLVPFADRVGRRRIFLLALIGMSLGTLLTGFSQTPVQFTVLQLVTRSFMLTAAALSVVILVEEFPANQRGSALGMMSVLGGMGYGLGAGLYAAVNWLPFGWRALYAAGVLPLLLLPFFRRELRETRRFAEHAERSGGDLADASWFGWLAQLVALIRTHPRRAAAVGSVGLFGSMGSISVFQYTSAFVQSSHGWAPGQYSLLVLGGGLLGLFGNVVGGRGSDRFGRRTVGFLGLALSPLFAAAFFIGPAATLALCWGLYVLCMAAGDVVVRALSAELFPTSQRSTSSGLLVAIQAIGFSTGLFVVGLGTGASHSLGTVVVAVSCMAVPAAICLLFLPETRQRELEGISGDPAA